MKFAEVHFYIHEIYTYVHTIEMLPMLIWLLAKLSSLKKDKKKSKVVFFSPFFRHPQIPIHFSPITCIMNLDIL